jgi:hypothetical protein
LQIAPEMAQKPRFSARFPLRGVQKLSIPEIGYQGKSMGYRN